MTSLPWHAYYYDGLETSRPPTRIELIEAESETNAAKIAKSHMGGCKRVDIAGPRWVNAQTRVILAGEEVAGRSSVSKLH